MLYKAPSGQVLTNRCRELSLVFKPQKVTFEKFEKVNTAKNNEEISFYLHVAGGQTDRLKLKLVLDF